MSIALVILAAGASKRMGAIKQLLPWRSTSLLGHTIDQAQKSTASKTIVVLGANAIKIRTQITKHNLDILINEQWEEGMGTSIKCAVNYLISDKYEYSAVLFVLADQPLIKTSHYDALISAFTKTRNKIIASRLNEKAGVPALFSKSLFSKLLMIQGDIGAKKVIAQNTDLVHAIRCADSMIDIDTQETYQKMYREFGDPNNDK